MRDRDICPECGSTLNQNGLCRTCLLEEAKRLFAQLTDSEIAKIIMDVFDSDTMKEESNA